MSHDEPLDEVLRVKNLEGVVENKGVEESLKEFEDIEKMMEEEIKAWEHPKGEEFSLTKPRA